MVPPEEVLEWGGMVGDPTVWTSDLGPPSLTPFRSERLTPVQNLSILVVGDFRGSEGLECRECMSSVDTPRVLPDSLDARPSPIPLRTLESRRKRLIHE